MRLDTHALELIETGLDRLLKTEKAGGGGQRFGAWSKVKRKRWAELGLV